MPAPIKSVDESKLRLQREFVVFWLLIPLVMAVTRILNLPNEQALTMPIMAFNFAMALFSWLGYHFGTLLVVKLISLGKLRLDKNSLINGIIVLSLGGIVGSILIFPTRPIRIEIYCDIVLRYKNACDMLPPPPFDFGVFVDLVRLSLLGIFYWLLGNYLVASLFNIPRYGWRITRQKVGSGEDRDGLEPEKSPLLSRLPLELGDEVIALSANQHYLKVETKLGNAMVLYRLSDAVRELGDKGAQIHRSHWVAFDAIRAIEQGGSTFQVILENGTSLPVSRGNRHLFKSGKFLRMQVS